MQARGAVSDDELREVIGFLRSDFPACDIGAYFRMPVVVADVAPMRASGHDAPVVFGGLNQRLRQVSLEVKSVVHVAENADGGVERTLFHCLVNNVRFCCNKCDSVDATNLIVNFAYV